MYSITLANLAVAEQEFIVAELLQELLRTNNPISMVIVSARLYNAREKLCELKLNVFFHPENMNAQ
jgi:hypothetical protein